MNYILSIIITAFLTFSLVTLNRGMATPSQKIVAYKLKPFEVTIPKKEISEPEAKELEAVKKELEIEVPPPFAPISTSHVAKTEIAFTSNLNFQFASIGRYNLQQPALAITPSKATPYNPEDTLVLIYQEKPIYPLRAKQLGLEGKVHVQFIVNEDGSVSDIKVMETTHNLFIAPVEKAISRYRFKPPVDENGAPTKVSTRKWITYEIR